jgi:phage tail sheath protein FI
MPTQYTYPGVYIEEVPSGVRTITGVSTSDTAFIDFFARGPVDEAVRITSFADFERVYGSLDRRSEASYAIRQFYLNGGSVAWVVRVAANPRTADRALPGGSPPQNTLTVAAASPGEWGNALEVGVDHKTASPADLFNLAVREVRTAGGGRQVVATETFRNLSLKPNSPRFAPAVVNAASSLVRLTDAGLVEPPDATGGDVIATVADPNAAFLPLGQGGGHPGDDGVKPGSADWVTSKGADALLGKPADKTGVYALERIAPFVFNLLCTPAAAELSEASARRVYEDAAKFCRDQRAFVLVDIPESVQTPKQMTDWVNANGTLRNDHAAVYYPRLLVTDPLNENRPRPVAASGTLAGVYARTDATRGVWKAPAGTDAVLRGASLERQITDLENGALNPLGVNALRNLPLFGNVSWGARTLDGSDQQASEWKYIPVRRTALFIEESLYQGLKWVVFEPNDEPLWAQIRLNVGAFMQNLFRQGAFQGRTPREAYFVKCDRETTTQNDINLGIVNIVVGFAPLKPAEFVVIKIQQLAGQIET